MVGEPAFAREQLAQPAAWTLISDSRGCTGDGLWVKVALMKGERWPRQMQGTAAWATGFASLERWSTRVILTCDWALIESISLFPVRSRMR